MQYTPNYNLITVEGTDVVNPLVQMNPNFTDIDAAMFANKQAVIGTATEITAGTVHSITRANTDSDYFRFTATSNWTAGDTMNVDGVSVSIYLSDGTAPSTGAYVINTEVLALLSGSRVTLITSNGSVVVNASDVVYDNTVSGLTATDAQDAIDELAADVNKGSVSVISDGVKTNATLLNELFALVDSTKINPGSKIVIGNQNVAPIIYVSPTQYQFCYTFIAGNVEVRYFALTGSSSKAWAASNNTVTDNSNNIPSAGIKFEVIY